MKAPPNMSQDVSFVAKQGYQEYPKTLTGILDSKADKHDMKRLEQVKCSKYDNDSLVQWIDMLA